MAVLLFLPRPSLPLPFPVRPPPLSTSSLSCLGCRASFQIWPFPLPAADPAAAATAIQAGVRGYLTRKRLKDAQSWPPFRLLIFLFRPFCGFCAGYLWALRTFTSLGPSVQRRRRSWPRRRRRSKLASGATSPGSTSKPLRPPVRSTFLISHCFLRFGSRTVVLATVVSQYCHHLLFGSYIS